MWFKLNYDSTSTRYSIDGIHIEFSYFTKIKWKVNLLSRIEKPWLKKITQILTDMERSPIFIDFLKVSTNNNLWFFMLINSILHQKTFFASITQKVDVNKKWQSVDRLTTIVGAQFFVFLLLLLMASRSLRI